MAIAMPMTHQAVAIYLGVVLAGMAAVSIADSFSALEIGSRTRIARTVAIFTQVGWVRGVTGWPARSGVRGWVWGGWVGGLARRMPLASYSAVLDDALPLRLCVPLCRM